MISIIIPCYNCEKFVRRAIESVVLQTYKDWELLLINNNSSDRTQVILEEYQSKFPLKITVYQEVKKGAPAARNKGLYNAKGDWIQYLDADDELMVDKLNRQMGLINKNNIDIVAGSFIWVKKEREKLVHIKMLPDNSDIWLSLVSSSMGRTSANLWKKACILNVNGWDETLSSSQEYNLLFRLVKNKAKIFFDEEPSAFIYKMENSISKSVSTNRNAEILKNWVNLRLQIKEYLIEIGRLNKETNRKIDCIIFKYLIDKKNLSPAYVNGQLKNLHLDLPLTIQFKRNYKYFVNKLLRNFKVKM